ncbi:hypothetical protein [Erythrobacter sp. Alg231-14]|uniref:hypothetical protein n=1 Tax=Erythrobacter sp. Alg231-14 TaxID=1922225 RepID=UPI00307C53C2
MTDLSKVTSEFEARRRETLADDFDFQALREMNRDSDGSALNDQVDLFLDWASALLRRIPKDWKEYSKQPPADLHNLFEETAKLLQSIQSVSSQTTGARGAHLSNLSGRIQGLMAKTVNSNKELLFLQMIGEDRSSEAGILRARLSVSLSNMEKTLNESRANASKLQEMAEASKEATAKIAASGRARVFHNEGKGYEDAARIWLVTTAVLAALLTFLAFAFALGWLLPLAKGADAGQLATHLFSKALILFTLGAALTFSAKQYSANRHNAVQNYHRSSALRTYRALLAATRDEAVHEAILQQAAQAIFSPSDTGYSKHAAQYDQTPIVQLVQGMTKDGTPPA